MLVAEEVENVPVGKVDGGRVAWANARGQGPRQYRAAMILTAWGTSAAVWCDFTDAAAERPAFSEKPAGALLSRILTPGESMQAMRRGILKQYPNCREVIGDRTGAFHSEVVPTWFPELVKYLQQYYTAGLRDWSTARFVDHWSYWQSRLDWQPLTAFQRAVLETIAEIPCGVQWTYGQVAARLGKPKACRAVGGAVGANPWPVLVPCHRVVGSSGALTGFSAPGGVRTKARMLALESY